MHKNYLVTGVAGSGKSTLRKVFDAKGYQTIDIDEGYAEWRDKSTNQVVPHNPEGGMEWLMKVDWLLKLNDFTELLEQPREQPLFVFGGTGDLTQHLDLFDQTYLLEYPDEATIRKRLAERTDNPYGKHPDEVISVLRYVTPYQNTLKRYGAMAINCTLPIETVVEAIENDVNERQLINDGE